MIQLDYHLPTKSFYYRGKKQLTWGYHQVPLPFPPSHSNCIRFSMIEQAGKIGPLVGILTNTHSKRPFGGNLDYFQSIQIKMLAKGGLSFVFTSERMKKNSIIGWMYVDKKWVEAIFPYPNMVYNRISSPAIENKPSTKEAFKKLQTEKIPYFNPSFFNKWEITQLLQKETTLHPFLPETILFQTKQQAAAFVEKHRHIYIKPVYGNKGNGIFTLKKKNNHYTLQSHQFKSDALPFQSCWNILNPYLQKEPYILQKSVRLQTYNNCIFDFRVLAQKINLNWIITGIGIRMAKEKGITTHVPKGGTVFPLNAVKPPINFHIVHMLIKNSAAILEKNYDNVKEFSMDIGRDKEGNYSIFEINAKPMSFDEKNIQAKRMNNLINIFFHESGFQ
ncbi:YheC/YheD family protein [Bacillus taeanensis]|uniref:ATP-grasp domain-containing protein n=1 Tax=Bacillus taeanensis TaxID=273032 RepID=A0A366XT81_9BACI|nr:YheC/YheD family protein [Bacillus taeanensis]RBW69352.1 hypothetical protein DS031_12000 [Bacillus taeanensis]